MASLCSVARCTMQRMVRPVMRASAPPLYAAAMRVGSLRGMANAAAEVPASVEGVNEALRLLRTQPQHYVVASITGRTFVLSESDLVTLPHLRGVQLGDVLELDMVHEVGSRDYTLRAQDPAQGARNPQGGKFPLVLVHNKEKKTPVVRVATDNLQNRADADSIVPFSQSWGAKLVPSGLAHVGAPLSSDIVKVQCVVVEHTKGPLERIEKFKRRKSYDKTITHKQPYTRVRVDTITLGAPGST